MPNHAPRWPLNSYISAKTATCCIHVPELDTTAAMKNVAKLRLRKTAPCPGLTVLATLAADAVTRRTPICFPAASRKRSPRYASVYVHMGR
jgi:hypothetical protein